MLVRTIDEFDKINDSAYACFDILNFIKNQTPRIYTIPQSDLLWNKNEDSCKRESREGQTQ